MANFPHLDLRARLLRGGYQECDSLFLFRAPRLKHLLLLRDCCLLLRDRGLSRTDAHLLLLDLLVLFQEFVEHHRVHLVVSAQFQT